MYVEPHLSTNACHQVICINYSFFKKFVSTEQMKLLIERIHDQSIRTSLTGPVRFEHRAGPGCLSVLFTLTCISFQLCLRVVNSQATSPDIDNFTDRILSRIKKLE